jgi:glycosyltransferase involved in cell wall biosynthesis
VIHLLDAPLVSVVIIFWNEEVYLQQAIDSVLVQEYENWELILVDDGSTDRGPAIARAAQAQSPQRIRLFQHPDGENRGMAASRNLGMSRATGDYITFLDADDFFMMRKLTIQVEYMRQHPEVAATCGRYLMLFSDERDYQVNHQLQELADLPNRTITGKDMTFRMNVRESLTPQHGAMLIRLEVARSVGGFAEQFQGIYEDSVFFTKVFGAHNIYVSNDCVTVYRMHWASWCHRAMDSGDYPDTPLKKIRYQYNQWLFEYLKRTGGHWRLIIIVRVELLMYKYRVLYPIVKSINKLIKYRRLAEWLTSTMSPRSHRLPAAPAHKSEEFISAIDEVARFYRKTGRFEELDHLMERLERFLSADELARMGAE